jgi:hypothetical protein
MPIFDHRFPHVAKKMSLWTGVWKRSVKKKVAMTEHEHNSEIEEPTRSVISIARACPVVKAITSRMTYSKMFSTLLYRT